eukprot:3123377-Alexandrium_andersonii.AAC.1
MELLQDDRVAMHLGTLELAVQEEQAWIAGLSPAFWARLARVVGDDTHASGLRSQRMRSGSIAAAYLDKSLFQ